MLSLPAGLAAHLGEGVTTLCRCWRLVRPDGAVLGFTDHDRDIDLDGTVCRASSGLTAAEAALELGVAVGGGEVSGALDSGAITEADILAGLYDAARVETWIVDWSAPERRVLQFTATIGEIRREDDLFVAELRSALHRFDEEQGRLYRSTCSADLGDARCRVDLSSPIFGQDARVASTDGRLVLTATGLDGFASGWFTGGRLTWISGANAGRSVEIARHQRDGTLATLELWQAGRSIVPGDRFRCGAGCDKRLATCRDRFGNTANFRGFPHMPGNASVTRVIRAGDPGLDGGSLFR